MVCRVDNLTPSCADCLEIWDIDSFYNREGMCLLRGTSCVFTFSQAISRRPLTAEAQVRSQVSPCEIYGGQSGNETGFSPSSYVFPVSIFPPNSILIFIYMLFLPEGQTGEAWEPTKNECSLGNRKALDRNILSLFRP